MVRILVDVNLSPSWVNCLGQSGIEATHWSSIGAADAPDTEIMEWAATHDCVVFTHDLDFGALLHLTAARKPSVVQIRAEDVRPATMGKYVCAAIFQTMDELHQGALVTIDPRRNRVALLPFHLEGGEDEASLSP
jgi:predicted nuclease of predicted toxin-antitoxin system